MFAFYVHGGQRTNFRTNLSFHDMGPGDQTPFFRRGSRDFMALLFHFKNKLEKKKTLKLAASPLSSCSYPPSLIPSIPFPSLSSPLFYLLFLSCR